MDGGGFRHRRHRRRWRRRRRRLRRRRVRGVKVPDEIHFHFRADEI